MKETKRIKTRILMRRDTSANWATSNPVLLSGEIGYDITVKKCKIGDGVNHWLDLPFFALQIDESGIDYQTQIINKPQIQSVELSGNLSLQQLGIPTTIDELSQTDTVILYCGNAVEVI